MVGVPVSKHMQLHVCVVYVDMHFWSVVCSGRNERTADLPGYTPALQTGALIGSALVALTGLGVVLKLF